MAEATTMAFYTDTETKKLLEQWAREDDRSVSWIIRQLIEMEKNRRLALTPSQPTQWEKNIDAALGSPANQRVEAPVNDRVQAGVDQLILIR